MLQFWKLVLKELPGLVGRFLLSPLTRSFVEANRNACPWELAAHRARMLEEWHHEVRDARRENEIMWKHQKERAPHTFIVSGHINVALVRRVCQGQLKSPLLARHLQNYPDVDLWQRILRGHSLTSVPVTGVHHSISKQPRVYATPPAFKFKAVRPSWMGPDLIAATKNSVQKEVSGGLYGPELAVSELKPLVASGKALVARLFSIQQPQKKRTVAHFEWANPLAEVKEGMRLPDHSFLGAWFVGLCTGVWLIAECARAVTASLLAARNKAADWAHVNAVAAQQAEPGIDGEDKDEAESDDRGNNDVEDAGIPPFESEAAWAGLSQMAGDVGGVVRKRPRRRVIRLLKRDFKSAYKQLCVEDPWSNVQGFWDDLVDRWVYRACFYCSFGAVASVWAWISTIFIIKFVLIRVFFLLTSIYVDDLLAPLLDDEVEVFVRLPDGPRVVTSVELAELAVDAVIDGFGFRKSDEKSEITSDAQPDIGVLGAKYEFAQKWIDVDAEPEKKLKMRELALETAAGVPAQSKNMSAVFTKKLQRLAGQVQFMIGIIRFSLLRALVQPVHAATGEAPPPVGVLKHSLLHLAEAVSAAPAMRFDFDKIEQAEEVVILSDAAGAFSQKDSRPGIGAVAVVSRKVGTAVERKAYFFRAIVPAEVAAAVAAARENGINYFELVTVIVALHTFRPLLRGRARVRFMIDNTAALYAANRGASRCPLLRRLAQRFHSDLLDLGVAASCRYVPSAWNVSDGLTRENLFDDFEQAVAPYGPKELSPILKAVFDLKRDAQVVRSEMDALSEAKAAKRARTAGVD